MNYWNEPLYGVEQNGLYRDTFLPSFPIDSMEDKSYWTSEKEKDESIERMHEITKRVNKLIAR